MDRWVLLLVAAALLPVAVLLRGMRTRFSFVALGSAVAALPVAVQPVMAAGREQRWWWVGTPCGWFFRFGVICVRCGA